MISLHVRLLNKGESFDPAAFRDFVYDGPNEEKSRTERAQLINGLLLADHVPTSVKKRRNEQPADFEVQLRPGERQIYVEVTEATLTEHSHLEATTRKIDQELVAWFNSSPKLSEKFAGLSVQLLPREPIPKRLGPHVLKETMQFFEQIDPAQYKASPFAFHQVPSPKFSLLKKLGCEFSCIRPDDGTARIGMGRSRGWNPWAEAVAMLNTILHKRDKAAAARWSVQPLWLVAWVSTPMWDPGGIGGAFANGGADLIAPFETVILAGRREGVEITAALA